MDKLLKYVFVLCFLVQVLGCTKKQSYEIVSPKPYNPCYPGSWWKYMVNDSIIIEDRVSQDYLLHNYWTTYESEQTSEFKRVPFVNGRPKYGYSFVKTSRYGNLGGYSHQHLYPYFSEVLGEEFEINEVQISNKYGDFNEHGIVKSKFFDGNDSIILIESHWVWGPHSEKRRYKYYAKNIGLLREFLVDTVRIDTLLRKELIDYHIGN